MTATILYIGPWIDVSRNGEATGLTANGYTLVNVAGPTISATASAPSRASTT